MGNRVPQQAREGAKEHQLQVKEEACECVQQQVMWMGDVDAVCKYLQTGAAEQMASITIRKKYIDWKVELKSFVRTVHYLEGDAHSD